MSDVDLSTSSILARSANVLARQQGAQLHLVLRGDSGGVFLNLSAWVIWELFDGVRTLRELSATLEADLQLPRGSLLGDVLEATERLLDGGFLSVQERAPFGELHEVVDWEQLARPAVDLIDLQQARTVFEARWGHPPHDPRPHTSLETTFCEGRIALRNCYPELSDLALQVSPEHPNIVACEEYLRRWPAAYRFVPALIHSLHCGLVPGVGTGEDAFLSYSLCHSSDDPDRAGEAWSTINCPYMLAENLVHEAAHQKLFLLGIRKESASALIGNDDVHRYQSPAVPGRLRPMPALVHGLYAYTYVVDLGLRCLEAESRGPRRDRMLRRLAQNAQRLEQGCAEMRPNLETDSDGAAFFRGLNSYADQLVASCHEVFRSEGRHLDAPPRA